MPMSHGQWLLEPPDWCFVASTSTCVGKCTLIEGEGPARAQGSCVTKSSPLRHSMDSAPFKDHLIAHDSPAHQKHQQMCGCPAHDSDLTMIVLDADTQQQGAVTKQPTLETFGNYWMSLETVP